MRPEQLDKAYGATPLLFTDRIDSTLRSLEEEKPMQKVTLRAVLMALLIVILLCGIAYAVITQGQEWYYNNRFTALQENEPETYDAIMNGLQTAPTQANESGQSEVKVVVQDVAWVADSHMLTLSLAATPKNPMDAELHPMWNLDADGSYTSEPLGEPLDELPDEDSEERNEHWLWTENGCGPVEQVMSDPTKKLLLFEASNVYVGTPEGAAQTIAMVAQSADSGSYDNVWSPDGVPLTGGGSSVDAFDGQDGAVITVLKMELSFMDDAFEANVIANDYADDAFKASQIKWKQDALDAIFRYTDDSGMLTLCLPYDVMTYSDGDYTEIYATKQTGYLSFQVKVQ